MTTLSLWLFYPTSRTKLSSIVTKHWRVMVNNDSRLREIYKKPPMVSYRKPANLKDKLVRAKLPPVRNNTRPRRTLNAMRKCGHCVNCPWVVEGKEVRATATNTVVTINAPITCQSYDCLYVVGCTKNNCNFQYIGKAEGRKLTTRWGEHRGYINNKKLDKATGAHFNSKGHSVSNVTFTGLEQCMNKDPVYIGKREVHQIRKFDAKYNGLNRRF